MICARSRAGAAEGQDHVQFLARLVELELISQRYERGSTLITSNLLRGAWARR